MTNYKRSGGSHVGAKVFTGIVTFLLLAAIVLTGLSFGLGWVQLTPKENPSQEQPDEEENPLANLGGAVLGEGEASGIKLMSAKIAPAEYSDYGVSTLAETAYKITITPDPVNAMDTYSWTCTNTQQITLSPASDTKSCNVEITDAFGTQATITIASNINPDINATVTVDYVKRITSVSPSVPNNKLVFSGDYGSPAENKITLNPTYGTGTITPEVTITGGTFNYNIEATTSVSVKLLKNTATRTAVEEPYTFSGDTLSLTNPYSTFVVSTETSVTNNGGIAPEPPEEVQLSNAYINSFITESTGTSSDATLTINYTYSYTVGEDEVGGISESGSTTYNVGMDVSALVITATTITPDKVGIIG